MAGGGQGACAYRGLVQRAVVDEGRVVFRCDHGLEPDARHRCQQLAGHRLDHRHHLFVEPAACWREIIGDDGMVMMMMMMMMMGW